MPENKCSVRYGVWIHITGEMITINEHRPKTVHNMCKTPFLRFYNIDKYKIRKMSFKKC